MGAAMSDRRQPSKVWHESWLYAFAPKSETKRFDHGDTGKWCIFAPTGDEVDRAWARVRAAVDDGRLTLAKVGTAAGASMHGGTHVICVYCPDSADRLEVVRVREVLREIGFGEELGYKTDEATLAGIYSGPDEWLYRL